MESNQRIYRYVVRYDTGTAPRPFDGVCSLAICKPMIRAAANVGDWIIGFRSRHPGEVLYAMQVTERLTLGDYWLDARFAGRRPGQTDYPDNFYRPTDTGSLEQVANHVHGPGDAARDCRGKHVLLGERFWYFGANSVPLPNELLHLVHTTQGHAVHRGRRPDDVAKLRRWLASWPVGMHGEPIGAAVSAGAPAAATLRAEVGRAPAGSSCGATAAPLVTAHSRVANVAAPTALPAGAEGWAARRIVLSRKGFDGSYGGMPSPILPDGRMVPLPIPAKHDSFTMGDVAAVDVDLGSLLGDLSHGRHALATTIHLDPDLDRRVDLRLPGWRPSLGQTGNAQSHLALQGVCAGDVFLFFGWFRETARHGNRWRFVPGAPDLHLFFGWLEVGEVLSIVSDRAESLIRHPWIANHPHVAKPAHYDNLRNTLYIAPERSRFGALFGGGLFRSYRPELQLTAPGGKRSQWRLPVWFHPGTTRRPLTYHGAAARWQLKQDRCCLQAAAKGQEFVLHAQDYPEAKAWVESLVVGEYTQNPERHGESKFSLRTGGEI